MTTTAVQGPVRVRFAPSPTGFLHVGGARTAIYNDLLRASVGGAFVLRIEDTDRERSDEAMTAQIVSALEWIGVAWDEGPFLQSERLARHRERAEELLAAGRAYRDFRSPEEIEAIRQEAYRTGVTVKSLAGEPSAEEAERRLAAGDPFVVRFRMPPGVVRFTDLVKGAMELPGELEEDFVLLRSDGSPTYHLSVVCDDVDMAITHVIRGEDHLKNTAKHVPLFEAFGAPVPTFAHLPLILGPDRKRLSKRTGATSVEEFRDQGILPQALYNYLALLGWSPGDDREVLSRDEMVAAFSVERLGTSASVFDRDKLAWMNNQYMASLPAEELHAHLGPFLARAGLAGEEGTARLAAAVALHRTRAATLAELAEMVRFYFAAEVAYDEELSRGYRDKAPGLAEHLEELAARFAAAEPFDKDRLEAVLRALAEERGVKAAALIHPTRMALSGTKAGPPLFDVVEIVGRDETGRRLARYAGYLRGL